MAERTLEHLWRNARFRALAALGVPVSGAWRCYSERLGHLDELDIRCEACGAAASWLRNTLTEGPLAEMEARMAAQLIRHDGCTHLGRLLEPDDEALSILTALEAMAK